MSRQLSSKKRTIVGSTPSGNRCRENSPSTEPGAVQFIGRDRGSTGQGQEPRVQLKRLATETGQRRVRPLLCGNRLRRGELEQALDDRLVAQVLVGAEATERYDVSWRPTAEMWADRYRQAGEARMCGRWHLLGNAYFCESGAWSVLDSSLPEEQRASHAYSDERRCRHQPTFRSGPKSV